MPRISEGGPASLAAVLVAGCVASPALHAEVSASVGAASDYRFRGVSLSAGDPSPQASVDFDSAAGAYAGAFLAGTRLGATPRSQLQWTPYLGYARRIGQGASIDLGASYSGFTRGNTMGYAEVHAGISWSDVELRLHYSPDYFRSGASTTYLQADASRAIGGPARAFLHLGYLRRISGATGEPESAGQWDARAGAAIRWSAVTASLSWGSVNRVSSVYPVQGYDARAATSRAAWVAQLSWFF